MPTMPPHDVEAGQRYAGFLVESVTDLPDLAGHAVIAKHERSGARLLHLRRDDPEHLFAVAFRTPPPDDTGLPHILEHTVLCGSKRFPVKDPFVELLKTSLATFLNAFTYPDRTVYPCASTSERDFYNLMRVYLDAVFHPLLAESFFKQEGHHYEFIGDQHPDRPLTYAGVVYNEMKGAYSDLDGIMGRESSRRLFPDSIYGRDSGGDPEKIPELTYEQFLHFHKTYYHPSNAWFFLHSSLPTRTLLDFLNDETLSSFEAIKVDTHIEPQPRWQETRLATVDYPVAAEDDGDQTAVALLLATNDLRDPVITLAMKVLDHYLLANDASPLRKAIVDSHLGDDLGDSGYCAYQLDTFFEVSLKGTRPDRANSFVDLVLSVCEREAQHGFDAEKLDAAFQQAEFSTREIGSNYPLRLMERVYNHWLYDASPVDGLNQSAQLEELHRRHASEPRFFESVLQKEIVENRHRVVIVFTPDPGYHAARERDFKLRMAQEKERLGRQRCEAVAREARELAAFQSAPNPPEALATLPRLAISDVPPEPSLLPTGEEDVFGQPLLRADVFAGGVSVLNLAFDFSDLDTALLRFLPLYTTALGRMGAAGYTFAEMATREARWTGGIAFSSGVTGHVAEPEGLRVSVTATLHSLDGNYEQALAVLYDRLLACDFSDRDHLRDIVMQTRMQVRSGIVGAGNHYAALYCGRRVSGGAAVSEVMGGFSQVRFLDRLADRFEDEYDRLQSTFAHLRDRMLERCRTTGAFVGSDATWKRTRDWVGNLFGQMANPVRTLNLMKPRLDATGPARVGIAFPSEVAFVAKAFAGPPLASPDSPALLLLATQLSYGYLWNEIRVKGGAYGARASFTGDLGIITLSSYRDPTIARTLTAFDGIAKHVDEVLDLSSDSLEQAVIGTVKVLDVPLRPAQACRTALARRLSGYTDALRKQFRERLLSLDAATVRGVCRKYLGRGESAPVCVLSGRELLERENINLAEHPLHIENL